MLSECHFRSQDCFGSSVFDVLLFVLGTGHSHSPLAIRWSPVIGSYQRNECEQSDVGHFWAKGVKNRWILSMLLFFLMCQPSAKDPLEDINIQGMVALFLRNKSLLS